MSTPDRALIHDLLTRLDRALPGTLGEALLVAVAAKAVPGATPDAVRQALALLAKAGLARRVEGRWARVEHDSRPPATPADVERLALEGLRVPALSPERITLQLGLPPGHPEGAPAPALDPEQLRALAWLVQHADVAAACVADAFRSGPEDGSRPAVSGREDWGPNSFQVDELRVRWPRAGRSHLVLRGACAWNEAHGFSLELDGADILKHGDGEAVG
jgi:hypothetical protein